MEHDGIEALRPHPKRARSTPSSARSRSPASPRPIAEFYCSSAIGWPRDNSSLRRSSCRPRPSWGLSPRPSACLVGWKPRGENVCPASSSSRTRSGPIPFSWLMGKHRELRREKTHRDTRSCSASARPSRYLSLSEVSPPASSQHSTSSYAALLLQTLLCQPHNTPQYSALDAWAGPIPHPSPPRPPLCLCGVCVPLSHPPPA